MPKAWHFFLERGFEKCGWLPGIGLVLWIGAGISCQTGSAVIDSEDLAPGGVHHEVYLLQGPWSIHIIEIDLVRAGKARIRLRTAKSNTALEGAAVRSLPWPGEWSPITVVRRSPRPPGKKYIL